MNKCLSFLFTILLAISVSFADGLWDASPEKAAPPTTTQPVSWQETSSPSNDWGMNNPSETENFSGQFDLVPADASASQFDLTPATSSATENFDLIPVDNTPANDNFDLIPVENSTSNDQFDLMPVEYSCKGTPSAEQEKLVQIKAELAIAKKQKAELDKANQQNAQQTRIEPQVPAPQPQSQPQTSSFKVHWVPLTICAGVAIAGGALAVFFDKKASEAANRIPVNHNTYKQSYDDAGNFQNKRNIAIGIAAAGLVGMGVTFLF